LVSSVNVAIQNEMQDFVMNMSQEIIQLINDRLKELEEKKDEELSEKEGWEKDTLTEEKGNIEGLVSDVKNGKISAEEAKGEMDEIIARVVSASESVREKLGAAE